MSKCIWYELNTTPSEPDANVANFYPSTGRYKIHGGIWKRGINNLLKDIGEIK